MSVPILPPPYRVPLHAEVLREFGRGDSSGFSVLAEGMDFLHDAIATKSVAICQAADVPNMVGEISEPSRYAPGMVTGRKKTKKPGRVSTPRGPKPKIFLSEWMDSLELTDEALADKLRVSRNTVWRWRSGERRLYLENLDRIADAMGLTSAADLYRRPGRRSVDALLNYATPEQIDDVIEFTNKFVIRDSDTVKE